MCKLLVNNRLKCPHFPADAVQDDFLKDLSHGILSYFGPVQRWLKMEKINTDDKRQTRLK